MGFCEHGNEVLKNLVPITREITFLYPDRQRQAERRSQEEARADVYRERDRERKRKQYLGVVKVSILYGVRWHEKCPCQDYGAPRWQRLCCAGWFTHSHGRSALLYLSLPSLPARSLIFSPEDGGSSFLRSILMCQATWHRIPVKVSPCAFLNST